MSVGTQLTELQFAHVSNVVKNTLKTNGWMRERSISKTTGLSQHYVKIILKDLIEKGEVITYEYFYRLKEGYNNEISSFNKYISKGR